MSKKFMRIFAVVLSLAMIFGTVAIMPTVSAKTAEAAVDDLIFNIEFDGYEKGDPIIDTVTSKTIVEACRYEAKPDYDGTSNGTGTFTMDGVHLDGSKDTNGIAWDTTVLDPLQNTQGGFTMNMWIRFDAKPSYGQFVSFGRNCTSSTRTSLLGQLASTNTGANPNNTIAFNTTYGQNADPYKSSAPANNGKVNSGMWYMFTFTQDVTTKEWRVYINGADQTKTKTVANYTVYEIATLEKDQYVGYYTIGGLLPSTSGDMFKGTIGRTSMYGCALTADEIAALYQDVTAPAPAEADYSAVEEAIAAIPADLDVAYTEASVKAVKDAVAAVDYELTADDQATVDGYAAAILDAISKLELIPAGLDISIDISDGVAADNGDGAYNITWNANVELGELTFDDINEKAEFTGYGVYYGTDEAAVEKIAAGETVDNAKVKYFAEGEDIDVYTIFGFRLKGVAAGRTRAAKFFITYKMDGYTYTVLSDSVSVTAE